MDQNRLLVFCVSASGRNTFTTVVVVFMYGESGLRKAAGVVKGFGIIKSFTGRTTTNRCYEGWGKVE